MSDAIMPDPGAEAVERFISRWSAAGGSERANYQLFLTELGSLLDLPAPDPANDDTRDNAYVFERRVHFHHGDGSESFGFIDLYRRGSFVLEAKKLRQTAARGFDEALLRARTQAESYARALPADEGRPPFLVVVDVGHVIELYSDFSRSGATYVPFPDPRSHRIRLDQLRDPELRARLRQVWLDPAALDPSRQAARVTREIAERLARIARALESGGYTAERVAGFLSRCLFTFFAEDVELIPKRSFADLLDSLIADPSQFVPMVGELWKAMDEGRFSVALRATLSRGWRTRTARMLLRSAARGRGRRTSPSRSAWLRLCSPTPHRRLANPTSPRGSPVAAPGVVAARSSSRCWPRSVARANCPAVGTAAAPDAPRRHPERAGFYIRRP